jgi:phage/plasmid-associated DNA primase
MLDAAGVIKQITSGDRIRVERKNKDAFSVTPRAKMFFSANELSVSKDNSDGFFRRWCIIPFEKEFENQQARRAQLFEELEGLFAKSVQYAIKLNKMSRFPGQGEVKKYRLMSDSVYAFVEEMCEKGERFETSKTDMYIAYVNYCAREGQHPVKQKSLGSKLIHYLKIEEGRTMKERVWKGVRIHDTYDTL